MTKKILYILMIILISVIGFYGGFVVGKKIKNIKPINQKALALDTINIDENINTDNKNKILAEDDFLPPQVIPTKKDETKIKPKDPDCPSPTTEYEDMSLLAIGQDTGLPDETYIPKNLKKINSLSGTRNDLCLIEEAQKNFEAMTDKARSDGYDIKASSAFRSYELQKIIMTNALASGNTHVSIAIAKPGHSEHQLGTTVDVTGGSIDYSSASGKFGQTDEARWMEKNAGDYGYIESYPLGKEDITGYMYEPWHYRYVGIENAKKMIENEQTINEFLK